jgi:hypothetical protein
MRQRDRIPGAVLVLLTLSAAPALADCQAQLRILAEDLHGVALVDKQNQDLAGLILQARRHCWVQQEKPAMDLINRARSLAGLKPATAEFDWENVPLESLEPASPRVSPPKGEERE